MKRSLDPSCTCPRGECGHEPHGVDGLCATCWIAADDDHLAELRQKEALRTRCFRFVSALKINDDRRHVLQARYGIRSMRALHEVDVDALKAFGDGLARFAKVCGVDVA